MHKSELFWGREWFERRVEAEQMFLSQGHTPEFARKRIEVWAGMPGYMSGYEYAEGFVQKEKAEPCTSLPVSAERVRRARASHAEGIARFAGTLEAAAPKL